jgi:transcriptional regulator with XRE-family HTH domain
MARIADHPLRLARITAGFSQNQLAQRAGVHRSALTAIEDGRTKRPSPALLQTIAGILDVPPTYLESEIEKWLKNPSVASLTPAAKNLLEVPPYVLSQYYPSFSLWRKELAKTPTAFASMLRLNPATVRDYESGKTVSMPDVLSGKLITILGVSPEYLVELEGLPRG